MNTTRKAMLSKTYTFFTILKFFAGISFVSILLAYLDNNNQPMKLSTNRNSSFDTNSLSEILRKYQIRLRNIMVKEKFNREFQKDEDDVIRKRIMERTSKLKKRCKRLHNDSSHFKIKKPRIYIVPEYKALYCLTPQDGSTSWLKVIGTLQGKLKGVDDPRDPHYMGLDKMSYEDKEAYQQTLRTYKKFVVIREPFQRLVSAYRNKFLPRKNGSRPPEFANLAVGIIKHYRSKSFKVSELPKSKFNKSICTFEEFLTYTLKPKNVSIPHQRKPRHWKPQLKICYHCDMDYNYVIDMDYIQSESQFLLKELGCPENISFPQNNMSENGPMYDHDALEYLSQVDPELLVALKDYYKSDYELLGYVDPPLELF